MMQVNIFSRDSSIKDLSDLNISPTSYHHSDIDQISKVTFSESLVLVQNHPGALTGWFGF